MLTSAENQTLQSGLTPHVPPRLVPVPKIPGQPKTLTAVSVVVMPGGGTASFTH